MADKLTTYEGIDFKQPSDKEILKYHEIEPQNLANGQFDGGSIAKGSVEPSANPSGDSLPSQVGKNGMALFTNGVSPYWATVTLRTLSLTTSVDDLGYSGNTCSFTAGENITAGQLVYIKSDGKIWKTDADAIATMPAIGLAPAAISSAASGVVLLFGIYRNDTLFNWTTGNILYASGTAGAITATAPSGTDSVTQPVAIALSADIIFFNPQLTLVTHT